MNIDEALAAILNCNELTARSDIHSAIKAEVDRIGALEAEKEKLAQNNAELIGQKGQANKRANQIQKQLEEVLKTLGAEGQELETQLDKLKTLAGQVTALEKEKAELQTKLDESLARALKVEKDLHLQNAGRKAGADLDAFVNLLGFLPVEGVIIEGEEVKIKDGEKDAIALKDYATGKGEWFTRALFPSGQTTPPPENNGTQPATPPNNQQPPNNRQRPSAPPSEPPKTSTVKTYLQGSGYVGIAPTSTTPAATS